jgi:hypothetical protein
MSLNDDVIAIAREYTGAGAEEYIRRRCKSLGLPTPQQLQKENIELLAKGIDVTAGAYMSAERVREFTEAVMKLLENAI